MKRPAASELTRAPLPLVMICDGNPTDPQTNSGVALNFIAALSERGDVQVAASISSVPPRLVQLLVQALAVHPDRNRWRQRARRGVVAKIARSLTRDVRVFRARPPAGSVLVHVRSFYLPSRRPYASFIDTTVLDDDRNWSQWEDSTPRRSTSAVIAMERLFYRKAALIATASHAARSSLVEDYGVKVHNIQVVGGGTNQLLTGGAEVDLRRPRLSEHRIRILFVGRDFLRKGGDLLILAASLLVAQGVDLEVVLAGCEVPGLPHFVRNVGFVTDREALADLYRECDIFCLPARWEPYGLVVQEAMATGTAVVVSNVGELPTIVEHERSGLVVPSENTEELAHAIARLIFDSSLRNQLAANGLIRATTALTWSRVAQRFTHSLRDTPVSRPHAGLR